MGGKPIADPDIEGTVAGTWLELHGVFPLDGLGVTVEIQRHVDVAYLLPEPGLPEELQGLLIALTGVNQHDSNFTIDESFLKLFDETSTDPAPAANGIDSEPVEPAIAPRVSRLVHDAAQGKACNGVVHRRDQTSLPMVFIQLQDVLFIPAAVQSGCVFCSEQFRAQIENDGEVFEHHLPDKNRRLLSGSHGVILRSRLPARSRSYRATVARDPAVTARQPPR